MLAVVASAAVLTLSLGACTLFDDTSSNAGISQLTPGQQRAFVDTANAVRLIGGVQSVSSTTAPDDDWGSEMALDVTVSSAVSERTVRSIASTLRTSFDRNGLAGVPAFLTLRTEGAANGTFEQRSFGLSDDAVASNFSYWRAAQAAIGTELRMELSPHPEGADRYLRVLSLPIEADPVEAMDRFIENFDRLARISDPTEEGSYAYWSLAGFEAADTLPPARVVTLLGDIRTIIRVNGDSLDGLIFRSGVTTGEGFVVYWVPSNGVRPTTEVTINRTQLRDTDWLAAIDVAVRASAETDLSFEFIAGRQQFRLLTSPCDGRVDATSDDQKFFDAVLDAGAPLSPGAAPGVCSPEF